MDPRRTLKGKDRVIPNSFDTENFLQILNYRQFPNSEFSENSPNMPPHFYFNSQHSYMNFQNQCHSSRNAYMNPPYLNHSRNANTQSQNLYHNLYGQGFQAPHLDAINESGAFSPRVGRGSPGQNFGGEDGRQYEGHDVTDGEGNDKVAIVSGSKVTKTRSSRDKWSVEDDKILCGAWFEHSTDCVLGTGQNAGVFWTKIMHDVNLYANSNRSMKSCKCRWSKMAHDIGKYVGCESKAARHFSRAGSGSSQGDIKSWTLNLFADENDGQQFLFFHCYDDCRRNPKFIAQYGPKDTDGEEYSLRGVPSTPRGGDDPQAMQYPSRPIGVKAAKCKARGKGKARATTTNDEKESAKMQCAAAIEATTKKAEILAESERARMEYNIAQWEFVERQSDREHLIANTKLLANLIQKGELSAAEEELRDKLIGVVYGGN